MNSDTRERHRSCPFCGGSGQAATFYGHADFTILKFRLASTVDVWLCLSQPVTQEAIDKLIALLEAQKDAFPTRAELIAEKGCTGREAVM
jgi:hypothetical protein